MFLAIFRSIFFSLCILEFQYSNIQYFVAFDSFREKKTKSE